MAITLGSITLPSGLRWTDEFSWNQFTVSATYTITGAVIAQTATHQKGRPITLTGSINTTWLARSELLTLQSVVDNCPDTGLTLTLHDARTFTVVPNTSSTAVSSGSTSSGAMDVSQVPLVLDVGAANPSSTAMYSLNALRLLTI